MVAKSVSVLPVGRGGEAIVPVVVRAVDGPAVGKVVAVDLAIGISNVENPVR